MREKIKNFLNKISKIIFVENKKEEINVAAEYSKAVHKNFYNNLNGMI